jgi:hypothetical protein
VSVEEFLAIAFEIRELARSIEHRFEPQERALERLGFSQEEMDEIFMLWERD